MASEDSNADTAQPEEEPEPAPADNEQPILTSAFVVTSAKFVADVVTSAFSNQADKVNKGADKVNKGADKVDKGADKVDKCANKGADKVDKGTVSGAAAASSQGNLQEGKFGSYLVQMESYLEKCFDFGGSPPATEAAEEKPAADASAGEDESGAGGL